eukprot:749868-Amphidinium_carterae.1
MPEPARLASSREEMNLKHGRGQLGMCRTSKSLRPRDQLGVRAHDPWLPGCVQRGSPSILVVTELMMMAGCAIVGGQTVTNPWPILGGVAMATVLEDLPYVAYQCLNVRAGRNVMGGVALGKEQIVRTTNIVPGDVLILTKPLGTQAACSFVNSITLAALLCGATPKRGCRGWDSSWHCSLLMHVKVAANMWGWTLKPKFWVKVREYDVPYAEYKAASVLAANESMMRLNMHAASLMHKHGAEELPRHSTCLLTLSEVWRQSDVSCCVELPMCVCASYDLSLPAVWLKCQALGYSLSRAEPPKLVICENRNQ